MTFGFIFNVVMVSVIGNTILTATNKQLPLYNRLLLSLWCQPIARVFQRVIKLRICVIIIRIRICILSVD